MTNPASERPATPGRPGGSGRERPADLRLARLHLRSGTYALARVELEGLAGADRLDLDAVIDLAEVRWRTGDLPGAGAAAAAWLEDEGAGEATGAPLALAHVICAESAADRGEADEAAAHVEAAAAGLGDRATLEAVLAGIAARAAWPWDSQPAPAAPPATPAQPPADTAGVEPPARAVGAGSAGAAGPAPATAGDAGVAPAALELTRAGAALVAEAPERAAVLLALALRADRAAAESVLAALEGADPGSAHASSLAFVRGEALRAAGHHEEARIAYASAERLALAPAEADPPGSSQ